VLITGIDPPPRRVRACRHQHRNNQVSSSIILALAAADQKIVQSKRAWNRDG